LSAAVDLCLVSFRALCPLDSWQNSRRGIPRQKTPFVSNVSHELKTPLTTIRMYADLLGEGRVTDPGKAKRYLHTIIGYRYSPGSGPTQGEEEG